jgi:hypothetical protein
VRENRVGNLRIMVPDSLFVQTLSEIVLGIVSWAGAEPVRDLFSLMLSYYGGREAA